MSAAPTPPPCRRVLAAAAASGASLILWELLLARVFAVVLFADLAHLALGSAMLGLTVGALVTSRLAPAEGPALERRLTWMLAGQALGILATVALALHLPLVDAAGPDSFYARDPIRFELLHTGAYLALNAALPIPAAFGGALMAEVLRRPQLAAPAYAADLGAAGLAAALFLPLCGVWAAPDLALVAATVALAGAAALRPRGALPPLMIAAAASLLALHQPLLTIDRAAGWDEDKVFAERWSTTARYSLFRGRSAHGEAGDWLLVDNGSASLVVAAPTQAERLSQFPSRGLVHALHGPGRVAVPAAGAGPEVAVALHHGHEQVVAVELDGAMFELLEEAYPGGTPYADPRVTALALDGRAALLQQDGRFDIVHLVWANFFGAAGRIQAAWTPQLLYTAEAIETWLSVLKDDGTLSMSGPHLELLEATARAALRDRETAAPDAHLYRAMAGADAVLLVKPRPFTAAERATLDQWMARFPRPPGGPPPTRAGPAALTDDRPHPDRLDQLVLDLQSSPDGAIPTVYRTMVWGLGLMLGGLTVVVGFAFGRGRPRAAAAELGLAAGLGYGYLALQVVLIHQMVLYVGHPTAAFATVLGAMLAGSGLGGLWVARAPSDRVRPRLRLGLVGVGVAGAALVALPSSVAPLLLAVPMALRVAVVAVVVGGLGFLAGLPMPAALRLRGGRHPRLAPLMWAINGWASVLAATLAVLLSRLAGYDAALGLALLAYGAALACTARWPSPRA